MGTSVNNKCKAFTSLEQSKKLAEILPTKSADMMWDDWSLIDGGWKLIVGYYPEIEKDYGRKCYPAWSLAALLNILPETIEDEYGEYDLIINMIYKKPEYIRLGDCEHSDFPSWNWDDNKELLDNIVEAVIWLNNNDYLRNGIEVK